MKKEIAIVASLAMVLVLCPVLVGLGIVMLTPDAPVEAASSCNIDITATGEEVAITCNVTLWAIGTVHNSDTFNTGTDNVWGHITNDSTEAVDLTVYGNDMTGGLVTWTLSTGGPGAATIRMMLGLPTGENYTVQTETGAPYLKWKDELASLADQNFGLYFEGPTSGTANEDMVMDNGGAGMSGLVVTASID